MPYTALCSTMEYNLGGNGTFVPFDAVVGGGFDHEGGEITHQDAIAAQDNPTRPMTVPVGTANTQLQLGELLIPFTVGDDTLSYIIPAAACGLPEVVPFIQGGVGLDALGARLQTDCYIRSCEVSCEEGGLVMVNYGWLAMAEGYVEIADPDPALPNDKGLVFLWHMGDVVFGLDSYKCQRWSVRLENSLRAWRSLDEVDPDYQRLPEGILPGMITITLSADFRSPIGYNICADLPDRMAFYAQAYNELGDLFAMDCTGGYGFQVTSNPIEVGSGDDEIIWHIEAEADHNDVDLWYPDITGAPV